MPSYYRKYVNDTLTSKPNNIAASNFLEVFNRLLPLCTVYNEPESKGMLSIVGFQFINKSTLQKCL